MQFLFFFLLLLYPICSFNGPVPIHCHCIEKSNWNIIQNIFFCVIREVKWIWKHTRVKKCWQIYGSTNISLTRKISLGQPALANIPARPAPNQSKPVWTSGCFQQGYIKAGGFFLTWNSSMVFPVFSSSMRQYAPILVPGSDASAVLPCEQWDTMTYRRFITQPKQTQIQREVWVSLDTPLLCFSVGATCLYCWRRKGQDCRG